MKRNVDFVRNVFKRYTAALQRAAADLKQDGVPNPGDLGRELEGQARTMLRDILPSRFGIEPGYVVDSSGHISNQQDLLIFDSLNSFSFTNPAGYRVLPVEGVFAAIEIKATLSKRKLREAIQSAETVKALVPVRLEQMSGSELQDYMPQPNHVFCALMAFDSSISPQSAGRALSALRGCLTYTCIIGKGNLAWYNDHADGSFSVTHAPNFAKDRVVVFKNPSVKGETIDTGITLHWFINHLLAHLEQMVDEKRAPIPLDPYFQDPPDDLPDIYFVDE